MVHGVNYMLIVQQRKVLDDFRNKIAYRFEIRQVFVDHWLLFNDFCTNFSALEKVQPDIKKMNKRLQLNFQKHLTKRHSE